MAAETGFSKRLRALRGQRKMSQQKLAENAGLTKETVYLLERGGQEPTWPTVLALAAALEVDCSAFQPGGTRS